MHIEKHAFLLCLMLAALALIGCEGKEGAQGPAGPEGGTVLAYIFGGIDIGRDENNLPAPWAHVEIHYTAAGPSVKINGISLSEATWPLFQSSNLPISPGQAANLNVDYIRLDGDPGTAQASITLPENFDITDPPPGQTLEIPVGEGFSATWESAAGADAYSAYFHLSYGYIDLAGNDTSYSYTLDTLFAGTSITIPSSLLFPNAGQISQITYSGGSFYIDAMQGPWQEGEAGNVTGDGAGFFYGWTTGGNLSIQVSGTSYSSLPANRPLNHMQEFLKKKAEGLGLPCMTTN